MTTTVICRTSGGYLDWAEHCWPVHGPMTLEQLTRELAAAVERDHKRSSDWGMKDTAAGPYAAWQWCKEQQQTKRAGQPSWLAQRSIERVQDLLPLDR